MSEEEKNEQPTAEEPAKTPEAPEQEAPVNDAPEEQQEETTEEAPTEDASTDEPKEEEAKEDAPAEEATEEEPGEQPRELPEVEVGQTARLHLRINDGKKDRIQIFEGMVIAASGSTPETKTITVRKVSKGHGVEKIIPLAMPTLEKVEIVKEAKVRRSKLYYLRNYGKRLRERILLEK